eukprot:TRINITY_DN4361_c0_g1_i19.p1 TRINITY_DN4361_c0_g1~~TRINITY_DN4361_c0_g1_i19.p1  ORF type:complete len:255 (-),score=9.24 TRINITY_DN4361_c0_g1_i19:407-1171(-)
MSGNEILLNMEHYRYFRPTEIAGSLLALSRVPEQEKFDWEQHPYVSCVIDRLVDLLPRFDKAHLMQVAIIFDRLRVKSDRTSIKNLVEYWKKLEEMLPKVYHKLTPLDCFKFLEITLRNNRPTQDFYDTYMNIFPLHVSKFSAHQLVIVLNFLTKHGYSCVGANCREPARDSHDPLREAGEEDSAAELCPVPFDYAQSCCAEVCCKWLTKCSRISSSGLTTISLIYTPLSCMLLRRKRCRTDFTFSRGNVRRLT